MANATYNVYVDWDNDGEVGGAGEEVTSRLMQLEWTVGLDRQSNVIPRANRNSAILILNNESGDYSPFNTSSPLTGSLLPGRLVQINVGDEANPFGSFPYTFPFSFNNPRWTGKLESIEPESRINQPNIAVLRAVDPLTFVAGDKLQVAMQPSQLTGTLVNAVLDAHGWAAGDRVIDNGVETIDRFAKDGVRLLSVLHDVEETEDGRLYGDRFGRVVFEEKSHRTTGSHTSSQGTFSDDPAADLSYKNIRQEDPLPDIYNVVPVTVTTYSVGATAVLWVHPESGGSAPSINPGSSRDFWASYPASTSTVNAFAVDVWTDTTTNTDFSANTQADGGGSDITGSIGVANSKFSNAMKITLTNNSTATAFIGETGGTALQARGTPVTKNDPIYIQVEDTTSQTLYGRRVYPGAGKWFGSSGAAETHATTLLNRFSSPRARLEITVVANRDGTHLNQVLDRTISDRITVVATGSAGLGINADFFIEAEHHRVNRQRFHEVTWFLTPV